MPYSDPAKARAHGIAYAKANPEARRMARQTYYLKNRERILATNRVYSAEQRASARASKRVWRSNNPRRQKHANLWHKYKLTLTQYEKMLENQKGLCLLCDEAGPLTVDHDHDTGRIRGLLCIGCNGALGRFERNILKLGIEKVLAYIQR